MDCTNHIALQSNENAAAVSVLARAAKCSDTAAWSPSWDASDAPRVPRLEQKACGPGYGKDLWIESAGCLYIPTSQPHHRARHSDMPKHAPPLANIWIGLLLSAQLAGCTGEIASDGGGAGSHASAPIAMAGSTAAANAGRGTAGRAGVPAAEGGAGADTTPAAMGCSETDPSPGPAPLNRLTRAQYSNTIHDLFGDVPELDNALGSASEASEFGLVQPDVASVELENYQTAAELVAHTVVATSAQVEALVPCATGKNERECAGSFVRSFGARVYRTPLTDEADIERHLLVYDVGAKTDHAHGIELVLQAMLQAPRFLYRVELGLDTPSGAHAVALSDYELAARLSYAFWDSAPDAALMAAAESGKLSTPEGLTKQLERVLADPKGSVVLQRFLERWLHLPQLDQVVKDATLYPEWTQGTLKASLRTQAQRFLADVLERQGGSLDALLTSSSVFVNADLASYYQLDGVSDFKRVELTDGSASGILTLPGFLAVTAKPAESSPIYRGKFVREALLCQILPAPPPNIPKAPDVMAGVSTRERLSQHEVDPACSGCHRLMDPIGFAFEHYDAIGKFRSSDAGDAIDDRGELVSTRDADGKFSGVQELASKLAGSAEVRQCMAKQWFRFALGRFEQGADACSITRLSDAFEATGSDLRSLPAALVETDAFRYRQREGQ